MLQSTKRRLKKLEAQENARDLLYRYIHAMDGGYVDDLLRLFTEDGELHAENEPPGSGETVTRKGTAEIRKHYANLPFGMFRHHSANPVVVVADDAKSATIYSYFITAIPMGIQGGSYEGAVVKVGNDWKIKRWHIVSGWCWQSQDESQMYFDPLKETLFGGAGAGGAGSSQELVLDFVPGEKPFTGAGTYKYKVKTMMGPMKGTMVLSEEAGIFTGTVEQSGEVRPIENGRASGEKVAYSGVAKSPAGKTPYCVHAVIRDGKLKGTMTAFGMDMELTGEREI